MHPEEEIFGCSTLDPIIRLSNQGRRNFYKDYVLVSLFVHPLCVGSSVRSKEITGMIPGGG